MVRRRIGRVTRKRITKKTAPPKTCKTCDKGYNVWLWIISEVALFAFIFYTFYLLGAPGNPFYSSILLLALINISVIACPVMRKHYSNCGN
ncbi:MAG: hypothetical protein ABIG93_05405 [archaeon]|nr:hypothetical protein [Nanoarchaeota archaeon]